MQEVLRFLRVLQRRKRLMILSLLITGALGALYFATTPRIYQSRASLLVQQNQPDTWSKRAGDMMVKDLMDTYRNMLSSDVVLGEALKILPPESQVDLKDAPANKWPEILRRNLNVSVVRKTNILEVTYRSKSPQAAAMVVDCIVTAYLKFMDKLHKSTASEMLEILTREKGRLEADLNVKEEELLALKHQMGDVILREGDGYVSMMAKALQGDFELLRKAQSARLEAESQLKALEAAIRNGEDLQQYVMMFAASDGNREWEKRFGPDSTTLSRIREQLLINSSELRAAQEHYGPAHSKVRDLAEKVRQAEQFLRSCNLGANAEVLGASNEELAVVLQRMARQRYHAATEYEKLVALNYEERKQTAMNTQHSMARLDVLNRDLNRMYKSLDVLAEQIKGIQIGKDNGMLGTAVLATPEVPTRPVKPSLPFVVLLSVMSGLGFGATAVYLVDMLDDRFGSVEEMKIQLGGIPILAMVRRLEPLEEGSLEGVQAYVRPNDPATEAFRTLRTALTLVGEGQRTIAVSSSEAGDGKTTVVANLAVTVAQSGKRTLLIDADIRRPRLTPLLGLRGRAGLTTLLRHSASVGELIPECVCASLMPGLDVIPSGPRAAIAAELLASERLPEFLAWAEAKYDYVFIDSPPSFVSDGAVIGRLADGVILVVRPDKNQRRVVIRAVENLATLGVNLFGLVLNHFTSDEGKYGYDYDYRYDYGYGHDESAPEEEYESDEPIVSHVPILRRSA
jgi:succinoglycan biosynthesis transport protein ExoP